MVNIEVSSFFNMKGASFVVDSFVDIVYMVMYWRYLVEPVFCGGEGEFIVVIEVYGA